jgi:chromosomal replication initiator protein
MQTQDIWQKSLQLIKDEVGDSIFELWFSPIRMLTMKENTLTLELPNRFFREWIEDYHPTLIPDTMKRVSEDDVEIRFKVAEKISPEVKRADQRRQTRRNRLAKKGIYLNPRYTFEHFVVGPSNQFAEAAALAVSAEPGKVYNPLFVYGGVGLGKTHLITAIGNKTVDRLRGEFNVLYVSAEQFTNEVVSAFRHGKTEELKAKFRNLDMILLDDVQFVENKTATQEELFHTLNALYERQKQIVISSDRPPKEIRQVTDRLRSRFSMGLIADIQPPEVETKVAIIRKKADADRLNLPDDVSYYVATRIKSNVRDLEGCLIRLGAHASLTGSPVTLEVAKDILRDFIQDDERPLTVETIMKTVSEYYGIRVNDMRARRRTKDIALPRQIAMYLARELTESSLSDIGKQMGGKDHATVIYAGKQIEAKRKKDETFNRMIENLITKLQP